jgi:hypothetical protein
MRWELWLSTFGYQRGRRHSSFCPGIFFGIPRLQRPEPRRRSKFGLRSSRFAKPCGPACGNLSRRAQRLGSGSKCAATAKASLTYIPELYRLIRSLPLISPFGLPCGSLPSGCHAAWVTGVSIYLAHPENSTISSNFLAIWFTLSRATKPCGPAYGTLSRRRPATRFSLPHPQNRAVQENVLICASPPARHPLGQPLVARPTGFPALRFPSRQFRMKPRADLQQRSNPPLYLDLTRTLRGNPRKNLQQSRFARPIPPDDPQNLPALDLKRNIFQRIDPI